MKTTFQTKNTLHAKTLTLLAAGFIGLSALGATPAFADGDGCKGSNSRCNETRAEEEARLARADAAAEAARQRAENARRAREAEIERERQRRIANP